MRTNRRTLYVLLLLATLSASCAKGVVTQPGKSPQPVLDNIAVQLAQATDGARAVRKLKEALLADGKITQAQSHTATTALIKIDNVIKTMNAQLATYESFTPGAKADLLKLFQSLESGYRDLTAAGVFPSNAGVDKILVVLDAALAALRVFLGGN